MRVIPTIAALALLTVTSACSDWGEEWFKHPPPPSDHPFSTDFGAVDNQSAICSPVDQSCGSGIAHRSFQGPAQMHEQ